jgi:hypothetical protein
MGTFWRQRNKPQLNMSGLAQHVTCLIRIREVLDHRTGNPGWENAKTEP